MGGLAIEIFGKRDTQLTSLEDYVKKNMIFSEDYGKGDRRQE